MNLYQMTLSLQDQLAMTALFAVRPMVMVGIFPVTDEPILTATARFQFALVVAIFAAAGAPVDAFRAFDVTTIAMLLLREAFIGAVLALMAGKIFWIAQSVGALVDNLAGYNNVQLLNPSSPEQSTPLADLMLQLSAAVFFSLGGLLFLAGALFESWSWWPVLEARIKWPAWNLQDATGGMRSMMSLIASAALPILFLLTVIDLVLGLVSRSAKGVDTSPVATPVKAAAALLSLTLFASVFIQEITSSLDLGELLAFIRETGARP